METGERMTGEQLPPARVLENRPKTIDILNAFFREKFSTPPGWKVRTLSFATESAPEGFVKVEGGHWKQGRKARNKSIDRTFFVRIADMDAFRDERAIQLGVCPKCWGEGRKQVVSSIDKAFNRYVVCEACGGSGLPK